MKTLCLFRSKDKDALNALCRYNTRCHSDMACGGNHPILCRDWKKRELDNTGSQVILTADNKEQK
jgi:hypothetical protein